MKRIVSKLLAIAIVAVIVVCTNLSASASESENYTPMDIFNDEFNPYGICLLYTSRCV